MADFSLYVLSFENSAGGIVPLGDPATLSELETRILALPLEEVEGLDFLAEQVGGDLAFMYSGGGEWEAM